MRIIVKPRGAGKTTELIEMSAQTGYYIVCVNHKEAHRVVKQAEEMGLNIPFPLNFDEFLNRQYYAPGIRGLLIDNADMLIRHLAKVPVEAITMTDEE